MSAHSFHIPVMGLGFSIDTPLKVAHLGIDSVISLADDVLLERMRKFYCEKFEMSYQEISDKVEDFRAKRITSYLNMLQKLVEDKCEELKRSIMFHKDSAKYFFDLLPDSSRFKAEFSKLILGRWSSEKIEGWIEDNFRPGGIDVNIMTKVDKTNYSEDGVPLPSEYGDAHLGVKGFARSDLNASLVLSAGMNPRLYGYLNRFDDFFPDRSGQIKKRIVLKVSDYRSALIQGKFLAKKGIWVSEYRVESGLNCGGHAFATDGYLLGPILEEFKQNRELLVATVFELLRKALEAQGRAIPLDAPRLRITAQGGVGTSVEHQFLIEHYGLDSVGWGSPFLLVPEVTNVDDITLDKLSKATERELYLSDISPLGVPFNSLRGNTKDMEKYRLIEKGRPGSSCPRKYLVSNREYTDRAICTASRQYQHLKLQELEEASLTPEERKELVDKLVDKSCLCVGLGTSALLKNNMDTRKEGSGVLVCPGPNMAYFSKVVSLREMVNHIYGRVDLITRKDRPHMFIKELFLYIDYIANKALRLHSPLSKKEEKYYVGFIKNLREGIAYYQALFSRSDFEANKSELLKSLELGGKRIDQIEARIADLQVVSGF